MKIVKYQSYEQNRKVLKISQNSGRFAHNVSQVITSEVVAIYLCSDLIMKVWVLSFTIMRNISDFDRSFP